MNENTQQLVENAIRVYNKLCEAIDNREWKYERDDERLFVKFTVNGDDIPMDFIIVTDIKRQLIRLVSFLPFKFPEDKRVEGAIATCAATYGLADGSFDFDISDGSVAFRLTASFRESEIGEKLLQYMISCACAMVDKYNDKFLLLCKGIMSISDFMESEG